MIRRYLKTTLWIGVVLALSVAAAAVSAQERPPPGFSTFWAKFQAAVVKGDVPSVAEMTGFPFYWGGPIDRAAFAKAYPKIFPNKTCFSKAKPQEDGPFYGVLCGELFYRFGTPSGAWKLIEVADND